MHFDQEIYQRTVWGAKDISEEKEEDRIEEEIELIRADLKEELAMAAEQVNDRVCGEIEIMEATTFNREMIQRFSRLTPGKPFECDECPGSWYSLQDKTGHVCPVLDTHKSAQSNTHQVRRIGQYREL